MHSGSGRKSTGKITDSSESLLSAFAVGMIIYGTFCIDTDITYNFDSVNIGSEKDKFPAVSLLTLDNPLNCFIASVTGVVYTVSYDDEESFWKRKIVLADVTMDSLDVLNGVTNGVK